MNIVYSNIDHCFRLDEKYVKNHPKERFQHSAWDFCGYIWYDLKEEVFYEEVWQYKSCVNTLKDKNLKNLINNINFEYGYE